MPQSDSMEDWPSRANATLPRQEAPGSRRSRCGCLGESLEFVAGSILPQKRLPHLPVRLHEGLRWQAPRRRASTALPSRGAGAEPTTNIEPTRELPSATRPRESISPNATTHGCRTGVGAAASASRTAQRSPCPQLFVSLLLGSYSALGLAPLTPAEEK